MDKSDLERVIAVIEEVLKEQSDPVVRSLLVRLINLLLKEFG